MGQHKHNPTAIAAAKGELPPKKRRWCMGSGCEQMMTGIASQQFSAPFAAKSGALRRTMM